MMCNVQSVLRRCYLLLSIYSRLWEPQAFAEAFSLGAFQGEGTHGDDVSHPCTCHARLKFNMLGYGHSWPLM